MPINDTPGVNLLRTQFPLNNITPNFIYVVLYLDLPELILGDTESTPDE